MWGLDNDLEILDLVGWFLKLELWCIKCWIKNKEYGRYKMEYENELVVIFFCFEWMWKVRNEML